MKKFLLILAMLVLVTPIILASACSVADDPASSKLSVSIVKNPTGGRNVNNLTCTYNVEYVCTAVKGEDGKWREPGGGTRTYYAPKTIFLKVYWTNEKGSKYVEKSYTFGFEPDCAQNGEYTITFPCPNAGQYFDKTFWVEFEWSEVVSQVEKRHLESEKAVCTVQ